MSAPEQTTPTLELIRFTAPNTGTVRASLREIIGAIFDNLEEDGQTSGLTLQLTGELSVGAAVLSPTELRVDTGIAGARFSIGQVLSARRSDSYEGADNLAILDDMLVARGDLVLPAGLTIPNPRDSKEPLIVPSLYQDVTLTTHHIPADYIIVH